MELRDRTVLITGGTSGIGLELATTLLKRGNTVIVTGRNQDRLDAVRRQYQGLNALRCDVSQESDIGMLYEKIAENFPSLDVLVNNAGIMRNLRLTDPKGIEDVTREIEILLTGPIHMVQQFLPHLMLRRGAAIINVSSGLAFIPMPISPIYCAAKAGLHSYTQSLRAQLKGTDIEVIEVAPPPVETRLFREEFAEEMKGQIAMTPRRLVATMIACIEAGRTEITPGVAKVLKAASRIAPAFMFRQMIKLGQPRKSAG